MRVRKKLLIAFFLVIAWVGALGICWYFIQGWMAQNVFSSLAQTVSQAGQGQAEIPNTLAQAYDSLRQQNTDYGAWLSIEGTRVNYPVMYTPAEPEKYLRKGFDEKYSMAGTPFLFAGCTWDASSNLVIYGHNMQSGDMFADLMNYLDKPYYEQHPVIRLDTLTERREYRVMAVVPFDITAENEHTYYQCTGAGTEETFRSYVEFLKGQSAYDTGVTAEWGDQLITLSTCSDYTVSAGRLLVVGRLESSSSLLV